MPKKKPAPPPPDLTELLESWLLFLRTERKSPHTVAGYRTGVRAFLRYCRDTGQPAELTRDRFLAFTAAALDRGLAPGTVLLWHTACTRFSAWMLAETVTAADPLAGLKGPKVDDTVIDPLTPDEMRALIKACQGTKMIDRRDEAIIRLMGETPTRATEVAQLLLSDTDVLAGTVLIRHAKGGRHRLIPFSPYTAQAIDRYLRLRRAHRLAATDRLWLGDRGHTFGYQGLYRAIHQRAELAGIKDMHPHRLRHTSADRWLDAGGSEGGLMVVAGWTSYRMLRRYTARRSNLRAIAESQNLNLGEY